ncbi:methyl-accepting chemotaxis protein [Paenibacillus sp. YN15]|uniref:methyl-accepting chemotaxis protein n=1 Tax=Paenibacillus sp. YN15 TaxID=1742774 RepID=UPI0015EC1E82|nr:methyl-accepting chemotaxis protein [Paenibacillus sp. YN15]
MTKLLSIRVRLILLLLIPSLLYAATSFYLLGENQKDTDSLTTSLYDVTNKSTSLVLNADRDMYQALTAYQLLASGALTADERTRELAVLQENIEQTNNRIRQAAEIMGSHNLLAESHSGTRQSVEQNLAGFHTRFDQWAAMVGGAVQSARLQSDAANDAKQLAAFEEGRERLNEIGEILDEYARTGMETIRGQNEAAARTVYICVGIAVVVLLGAGLGVIRHIMTTIRRIAAITRNVAAGDLRHEPKTRYARDELGQITQSVDAMVAKMKELIGVIAANTQFVQDASSELSGSSKESAAAAEHVAASIQEMTEDVETQARGSVETGKVVEEMSVGIQRVAGNASVIAEQSSLTSHHAQNGNRLLEQLQQQISNILQAVNQLSDSVLALSRKSDQIGEIADSITTFANQTNLLSLNASIEAARAGEHGRGFSVVANEIRKLASQSIESADGINGLIQETRQEIGRVSGAMDTTKEEAGAGSRMMQEVSASFQTILQSVQEMVAQIHATSAIAQEMSASSEEISATMETSVAGSGHILTKSQGIAAATEEQLAMMENISAASEELMAVVKILNDSVAYFKIA